MAYLLYLENVQHSFTSGKTQGVSVENVLLPITPGKCEITVNGRNETVDLINEGEVNILKSPGLSDISIPELILPMHDYPFVNKINGVSSFHSPDFYLEKFQWLKTEKQKFDFHLIRTTPDGQNVSWDTKMKVSLEDYSIVEDAEDYGDDVVVSLELKEYRNWGAKKLKVTKKNTATTTSTKKPKPKKKNIKKYTVKAKDTLKKIAKKYLGNSNSDGLIYKRNKKVIEKAAKKHGRKSSSKGKYLYAGTVLSINLKDKAKGGGKEDVDYGGGGGGR